MRKSGRLRFKTSRGEQKTKTKRLLLVFAIAFAVVAALSAAVTLGGKSGFFSLFEQRESTAPSTQETSAEPSALTGSANILLYCYESSGDRLVFAAAARADADTDSVEVLALDPAAVVVSEGQKASYAAHFARGGNRSLALAAEKALGIKFDRYAGSTGTGFKTIVNSFGGLKTTIEKTIRYQSDDFLLVLSPGETVLRGDTLLKYFKYCALGGSEGTKTAEGLLAAMIGSFLPKAAKEDALGHFTSAINNMESDISIVDFKNCSDYIVSRGADMRVSAAQSETALP